MPTLITNPTAGNAVPVDSFMVVEGGFGGSTAEENLLNVNGIPAVKKGMVNGPIPLDAEVAIPVGFLGDLNPNELSVSGPSTLRCGTTGRFIVSNFDSYVNYPLSATAGTAVLQDGVVNYTAPLVPGVYSFTLGNRTVVVTAIEGSIKKPSIVSPVAGMVADTGALVVTGSLFDATGTGPDFETFWSADLEIGNSPTFDSDNNDQTLARAIYGNPSTTFTVNNLVLESGKYLRIRYHGNRDSSEWSDPVHITPAASYINAPVVGHTVTTDSSDPLKDKLVLSLSWPAMTFVGQHQTFNSVDIEYSNSPAFDDGQHAESAFGMSDAGTGYQMRIPYGRQTYVRARFNSTTTSSDWSETVSFVASADPRTVNAPLEPSNVVSSIDPELKHLFTVSGVPVCNGFSDTLSEVQWKISLDAAGNVPIHSETITATEGQVSTFLTPGLQFNTGYYLHVTYVTTRKTSAQFSTAFQTQADNRSVLAPTVQSVTATPLSAVISLSAFQTSPAGFSDTHQSTQWEIATDAGFTNIVENSGLSTSAKVQYTPAMNLVTDVNYYLRVTYHGAKKVSAPLIYTLNVARPSVNISISTPNTVSAAVQPTISTNSFVPTVPGDVHASTDWQIASDAGFSNIVASSMANTDSKLGWGPSLPLAYNTTYYARARFRSTAGVSNWSPTLSFKTMVDNRSIQTPSVPPVIVVPAPYTLFNIDAGAFVPVNFSDTFSYAVWNIDGAIQNGGQTKTLMMNTQYISYSVKFVGASGIESGWSNTGTARPDVSG